MASINYTILKSIIETTIKNYNAKEQHYKINENHVFLVGVHKGGLDLLIKCPHTGKETNIHAEVNFMNVPQANGMVANQFQQTTSSSTGNVNDKDVMEVRQALKKNGSVADLFGDDNTSIE